MARLLTILSIILCLLFFPPAALALISNNAVPGDATYPIKRALEEVILKLASVHPTTKAWFSIERSDRRFEEAKVLLVTGKTQALDSLNELVVQTQSVAIEIAQIKDPVKKQELTQKLTEEIKKYDQGLENIKQEIPVKQEIPQAEVPTSATSQPIPTIQPTSVASPGSTSTPQPITTPRSTSTATPIPTATPHPTSTPQPSPTPTPPPQPISSKCDVIADPIERARCRLREIQLGLRTASQNTNSTTSPSNKDKDSNKEDIQSSEDKNLTPKADTDKIKTEKH
jgi:hypothetical protein